MVARNMNHESQKAVTCARGFDDSMVLRSGRQIVVYIS